MTKKQKEINRLQIERAKRFTEAIVAHQYKDYNRSLWAANEAGKISGQIAKVRREGIPARDRAKEKAFLTELENKYGKCEELFA